MPIFDFTSPEGKTYSVQGPDGATSEQAFGILQQQLGKGQGSGGVAAATTNQANNADASSVGDIAKSAGIGAAEGALSLAGAPADLANLAAKGFDYLTGKNIESYTQPLADYAGSQALKGYAEKAFGEFYQPQSSAGQTAEEIGQFVPAMIGGPESLATKAITRVGLPYAGSQLGGQAAQSLGLPQQVGQIGGAMLGAASPLGLSRVASPFTASAGRTGAVSLLENEGINLRASQITGNRALGVAESELGNAPGAGNKATMANAQQAEQFSTAALHRAGINGTVADTATMDAADNAIGNRFNAVAARNPAINIDQTKLFNDIDDAASDYQNTTGNTPPGFFNDLKKRITMAMPQDGNVLSGTAYQAIQSDIASLARRTANPQLRFAYYNARDALHDAVQNGLTNPADAQEWQAARDQYRKFLVIQKAVAGTSEAASSGLITPANLTNADKAIYGQKSYVTGKSPFSDLAHAANQVMKPLPNSGTPERAATHLIPTAIGALIGHGLGGLGSVAGGVAGPAIMGRLIHSPLGQAYLKNQGATALRQIPIRRNLISSGILGAQPNIASR